MKTTEEMCRELLHQGIRDGVVNDDGGPPWTTGELAGMAALLESFLREAVGEVLKTAVPRAIALEREACAREAEDDGDAHIAAIIRGRK